MQMKLFTIPIMGGEAIAEDLNVLLRTKKILEVESQLVSNQQGAHWCFCVKYLDDATYGDRKGQKTDYRQVLDEVTFKRFSRLREIRKAIAEAEAIPAFAVFTDEELAEMAKLDPLTAATVRGISGIGEKRTGKYAERLIAQLQQSNDKEVKMT
jgi:superfamily II DNA helicase RecQ